MEEPVRFLASGKALYGILHLPQDAAQAEEVLVMIVGGPQTRVGSHRSYTLIARELCRRGLAVLRFDYAGIGDGEGDFAGFAYAGPSLEAALDYLHKRFPGLRKTVLWSLCDGSAACALNARQAARRVSGMILCNPYVHSQQGHAKALLKHYYRKRIMDPAFWKKLLSFRMDPRKVLSSFFGLAKSATQASDTRSPKTGPADAGVPSAAVAADAGSSSAPVAAPAPAAPPGLVGPGDDPEGLPELVMEALEAYAGPLTLIMSTDDFTAQEFLALYRERDTGKRRGRHRTDMRIVDGADHTFTASEWKKAVCDLTMEAWDKTPGREG